MCPVARCITTVFVLFFLPLFLYSNSSTKSSDAAPDIKFEHLTVEDGLSQSNVYGILQDQQGFMWFSTEDGLNRFDGYKFKIYRHDPNDSLSLSGNRIYNIYQDHLGNLWLGTRSEGLCRLPE